MSGGNSNSCLIPWPRHLLGQRAGIAVLTHRFLPEAWSLPMISHKVKLFSPSSFAQGQRQPRFGRFYPRGLLLGYAQNPRFSGAPPSTMTLLADFNHPLAKNTLELEVISGRSAKKRADTGGECQRLAADYLRRPRHASPADARLLLISSPTILLPGLMAGMTPYFTKNPGWSTTSMTRPTPPSSRSMGVC